MAVRSSGATLKRKISKRSLKNKSDEEVTNLIENQPLATVEEESKVQTEILAQRMVQHDRLLAIFTKPPPRGLLNAFSIQKPIKYTHRMYELGAEMLAAYAIADKKSTAPLTSPRSMISPSIKHSQGGTGGTMTDDKSEDTVILPTNPTALSDSQDTTEIVAGECDSQTKRLLEATNATTKEAGLSAGAATVPETSSSTPTVESPGQSPVSQPVTPSTPHPSGLSSMPSSPLIPGKKKPPKMVFNNFKEKRLTYELTFQVLKYESILDKILENTSFYALQPQFRDHEKIVLMVLFDMVTRNFDLVDSSSGEEVNEICLAIAESIFSMKVRFEAVIARMKVREDVRSIDQLLPESILCFESIANAMPIYAWVNQCKVLNMDDLHKSLAGWGLKQVTCEPTQLSKFQYTIDKHCLDVLVFHREDKEGIVDAPFVQDRSLVIQDKSTCMALTYMMGNYSAGEDVMLVNATTVLTAVHWESLLLAKYRLGAAGPQKPSVKFYKTGRDEEGIKEVLESCGSTCVVILYCEQNMADAVSDKFKNVKHALCQARCTRSGVINPLEFISTENDDSSLLKEFTWRAKNPGVKPPRLPDIVLKNQIYLRTTIQYINLRAILFLNHSVYEEETSKFLDKLLESANRAVQREMGPMAANTVPFTIGTGNLAHFLKDEASAALLCGIFAIPPSRESNGYHITLLVRDAQAYSRKLMDANTGGEGKRRGTNKEHNRERASLINQLQSAVTSSNSGSANNANNANKRWSQR